MWFVITHLFSQSDPFSVLLGNELQRSGYQEHVERTRTAFERLDAPQPGFLR